MSKLREAVFKIWLFNKKCSKFIFTSPRPLQITLFLLLLLFSSHSFVEICKYFLFQYFQKLRRICWKSHQEHRDSGGCSFSERWSPAHTDHWWHSSSRKSFCYGHQPTEWDARISYCQHTSWDTTRYD